ncbi:MerR family transcriptional regulator [Comamonas sp. A7-5]|uniref:MerR family transcriptional regulator n=1 Tax=Comamonas sp. A7-5 TaxID=673549 RepID=UPI0031D6D2CB
MKIGELAQRTGLAASRIRFYERIGLLSVAQRQANGYRSYPEEAVLALRLIATAQRAGFSLQELRQLLPEDLEQWQHDVLLATLHRKLQSIDLMLVQLTQNRADLGELIAQIEARPEDMDCAGNARRVLSQMRLLGREGEGDGEAAGRPAQPSN